jgi:peptidoglycan-associated lipoprotein
MILVRRGRRASSSRALRKEARGKMQYRPVWCWWLYGLLLIAVTISGCPRKTPPPSQVSPGAGVDAPGLGESGLPSEGDTTRRQLEFGPERGGPLQDISFEYDSFELSTESREALGTNANWLQSNSQAKVEVEGHCDERGTTEYNLALGAKRAKAARDYLVNLGIAPDRLSTISYGEELPLCKDSSESCWQQNRRAHFLVINR